MSKKLEELLDSIQRKLSQQEKARNKQEVVKQQNDICVILLKWIKYQRHYSS